MKKKQISKIPIYDVKLSKEAIANATAVLQSGWLSPGKMTEQFEKSLSKLLKCKHVVSVSSATDGLQLVLMTLGIGPGDEVITTPFTFVATVESVLAVGATPVFADINPVSLTLEPNAVKEKITKNSRAVLPVDIAGSPADYTALSDICNEFELTLISDSAHAISTRYKRKAVSAFTDVSVISFHATKNLICGEGGAVLTSYKPLAESIRILSRHGLTNSAAERKKNNSWEYDAIAPGFKSNMSELHAAVGLGQLSVFEKEQNKRGLIFDRYNKNLQSLSDYLTTPTQTKGTTHGKHLYIIKLNLSALSLDRNRFIELMAKNGIECGVHYKPIFEMTYYKEALQLKASDYPVTAAISQQIVTLPLYPVLTLKQVDYISAVIEKIILTHKN